MENAWHDEGERREKPLAIARMALEPKKYIATVSVQDE